MTQYTGRYCGSEAYLKGEKALLRAKPGVPDKVLAQFDNLAFRDLAYGWHEFGRDEFNEIKRLGL